MGWGLRGCIRVDGAPLLTLDLDLPAGFSVVMGPSGSGKSTLLRLLAGLPCDAVFDGHLARPDRIGWLGQDLALQPRLCVARNVGLMRRLAGLPRNPVGEQALLDQVGLAGYGERRIATLSGGQKARVALARVLMQDAPLVVMDEPFAALDAQTRRAMQDLTRARLQGRAVLLVTHDRDEALRLADHLWQIEGGHLRPLPLPPALSNGDTA